jgi:hypothetical protein
MAISGRLGYVYVGGAAVTRLKDWSANLTNSVIDLDADIGSSWIDSANGFLAVKGNFTYNHSADDFNDLFDAVVAGSAVALYLYTSSAASSAYWYGSARLTDLGHTNPLSGTVSGSMGFASSGTWARQTTAA